MLDNAKRALSRLPVVGYALHWVIDVFTLPVIRLNLLREIRDLKEVQTRDREEIARQIAQCAAGNAALRRSLEENAEGIAALRQAFAAALTQLDVLYDRILLVDGFGAADARAEMQKRLWAMERRLSEIEAPRLHRNA